MTATTFWGNLAICCSLLGAMCTTFGLTIPQGGPQVYITGIGAALTSGGVLLNGMGNRHSQTGSPST